MDRAVEPTVRDDPDIFQIKARKCLRCGGLLTSRDGIRTGYGPCCLRKLRIEEADRKMMAAQFSLFQETEETDHGKESDNPSDQDQQQPL